MFIIRDCLMFILMVICQPKRMISLPLSCAPTDTTQLTLMISGSGRCHAQSFFGIVSPWSWALVFLAWVSGGKAPVLSPPSSCVGPPVVLLEPAAPGLVLRRSWQTVGTLWLGSDHSRKRLWSIACIIYISNGDLFHQLWSQPVHLLSLLLSKD